MDDQKLDHVKFSRHPTGNTKGPSPASVNDIMIHLSRTESRQDALMRRSEALVHRTAQNMVMKIDNVSNALVHIAENAQQTALKIYEIEQRQNDTKDVIADLQRQVTELQGPRASSSQPEPQQSSAAPLTPDGPVLSTTVKIDGFEVDIDLLESPMAVRWWQGTHRYIDVWLPPQRAVFDIDRHAYTVDLKSHWHSQVPEHRGVCVRYLGFKSEGNQRKVPNDANPRKRQRRRW